MMLFTPLAAIFIAMTYVLAVPTDVFIKGNAVIPSYNSSLELRDIGAFQTEPTEINCGPMQGVTHGIAHAIRDGYYYLRTVRGKCRAFNREGRVSCSYNTGIYLYTADGVERDIPCAEIGEWIQGWLETCNENSCVQHPDWPNRKDKRQCMWSSEPMSGWVTAKGITFVVHGDKC